MTESEAIKEFNKMVGRKMMTQNGISEKRHELFQIAMDTLEEVQKYRAIGTVEECREAMKKQKAKNPITKPENQSPHYENDTMVFCSNCNKRLRVKYKERFCCGCGQRLWQNK